jgi:hypothetical protein
MAQQKPRTYLSNKSEGSSSSSFSFSATSLSALSSVLHTHRSCKLIHRQSPRSSYVSLACCLVIDQAGHDRTEQVLTYGVNHLNGSRAATRSARQAEASHSNGVLRGLSKHASVQPGRISDRLPWCRENQLRSYRLHCKLGQVTVLSHLSSKAKSQIKG